MISGGGKGKYGDHCYNNKTYKGRNMLGKILMSMRDELKEMEQKKSRAGIPKPAVESEK